MIKTVLPRVSLTSPFVAIMGGDPHTAEATLTGRKATPAALAQRSPGPRFVAPKYGVAGRGETTPVSGCSFPDYWASLRSKDRETEAGLGFPGTLADGLSGSLRRSQETDSSGKSLFRNWLSARERGHPGLLVSSPVQPVLQCLPSPGQNFPETEN